MKIYTKTGDNGTTGLYGGARINKDDLRIEAYGTIDELNSQIGLLVAASKDILKLDSQLLPVQQYLFIIGSHLATVDPTIKLPSLKETAINDLENYIDEMEAELPALTSFVLPGGSLAIGHCHMARTICRRAERRSVSLNNHETINKEIVPFLNRLSDYFFVLSRYIGLKEGVDEIPWLP